MYIPKTKEGYAWSWGAQHTSKQIKLRAREKLIVELYMNWGWDEIGKDFSLTAWSDVEPVRVIHMGGLISDHWEDFSLDESIEIDYKFSSPN